MQGIDLIAQERIRQIEEERFNREHDKQHNECELAWLAVSYIMPHALRVKCDCGALWLITPGVMFDQTGFDQALFKRHSKGNIERLVKAGALIAAEIDRISKDCEVESDE